MTRRLPSHSLFLSLSLSLSLSLFRSPGLSISLSLSLSLSVSLSVHDFCVTKALHAALGLRQAGVAPRSKDDHLSREIQESSYST